MIIQSVPDFSDRTIRGWDWVIVI